jgi:replicative DNA helicase
VTTPLSKSDQLVARTLEIERSVLGGILIDPERYHDAREHITEADFFRAGHRAVFAAITRLMDSGKGVDLALVVQEMTAEELNLAEGIGYVSGLVDGVPKSMNVTWYAQEVAEKANLRALAKTARQILAAAEDADDKADTILEDAERAILGIRERSTRADVWSPTQRAKLTREQLELVTSGHAVRGVPTGLSLLDNDLRGLHAGNLITVGARPSMGKTALVQHFLKSAAAAGKGESLLFSLEMSIEEINIREVTTSANVNSWRLMHGHTTHREQLRLAHASEDMVSSGVHVVDAASLTVGQISAISRRMKAQHAIAAIGIDYLQLIMPERGRNDRSENRTIELGAMSRTIKNLARELRVPIVLLSQLSRASEARPDKRPQLADLRESGAIEQDSDVVLLIHRPNAYPDIREKRMHQDHYAEIIVAKQRNGPTGIVRVAFYREQTRFADYTEDPQLTIEQPELGAVDLPLESEA